MIAWARDAVGLALFLAGMRVMTEEQWGRTYRNLWFKEPQR